MFFSNTSFSLMSTCCFNTSFTILMMLAWRNCVFGVMYSWKIKSTSVTIRSVKPYHGSLSQHKKFVIYLWRHFKSVACERVRCRLLRRTTEQILQNKHVSTYLVGPLTICGVKMINMQLAGGIYHFNITVTLSRTCSPVEGDVYNFYVGKILSPVPV